jgi:Methyltransferase domain
MSLWSDFSANNHGRSVYKGSHYFPAYERHLARFCGLSVTMVEIGVFDGGSLEMWKKYLGPSAQVVGIDINPACRRHEAAQIAVRIGDQADPAFLQEVVDEFGPVDIVLDDGSHRGADIAATFEVLYPQLERNGVYIVEDVGTSYMPAWDGGLGRPGTFIETVKGRIDELHADYAPELEPTPFSRMTLSLHVYQNLVVFERGRHVDKRGIRTKPDKARIEAPPPVKKARS